MKKFLLGILLPVLTLVTLIGTGFATWYFGDNLTAEAKTANTTVNATAVATVGAITLANDTNLKLELDQSADKGDKTGKGIRLLNDTNAEVSLTGTYSKHVGTGSDGTVDAGNVTFTCTVVIPTNLAAYVAMNTDKATAGETWTETSSGSGTYTYTLTTDGTTGNVITINSNDFTYKAEPTTKNDYEAMKKALAQISVKFEAKHALANK